jgi:PknH-like extracellular domain
MGRLRIRFTKRRAALGGPAAIGGCNRRDDHDRAAPLHAGAVLAAAVVVVLGGCSTPAPTKQMTSPQGAPTVAPERLDSILLASRDVNTLMGASGMQPDGPIAHATRTSPATLSNPDCLAAFLPFVDVVYQGSGDTAISAEALHEPGDNPDHKVALAAASFPSADAALAFVKTSAGKWRACAGQTITETGNGQDLRHTFGNVVGDVPAITLLRTQEGGNGWACQRALRAVVNVVLDVNACGYHISDQGARMADKMAATAAPTLPHTTFPTPPPGRTVAPDRLESILPTVQDVNTVMGASGMQPTAPIDHSMGTSSWTLSNPDCQGAFGAGGEAVYRGSGYTAISGEELLDPGNNADHDVGQAAVSFPSADLALAFVKTSAGKWRACAGQTITGTTNGQDYRWTFANVVGDAPAITQLHTLEGKNGYGCQRALRAVLNVVLDVDACARPISDQADRIADRMAATATQQSH